MSVLNDSQIFYFRIPLNNIAFEKLPFQMTYKYAYCRYYSTSLLCQERPASNIIGVYDYLSDEPINDYSIMFGKDWLFGELLTYQAATFFIFNNAVWIRSNHQWGGLYYRTEADFTGNSPLNTAPFGQTLTAPTGAFVTVAGPIKCDFDSNIYHRLPLHGFNGTESFFSNLSMPANGKIGIGLTDQFTHNNVVQPHYGFQWVQDSWTTAGPTYYLSSYGGLKLFTMGTPRMVVTGEGNIGIGTTNPQAKLSVDGVILGKRVKVSQASTDWPDYVFNSDYRLPSLSDLDRYIKTNRHLPEIPSAKEIERDGLDLGEMNKKLLQKVEEQMLYIIQLNKRIEMLEEHISEIKKK